MWKKEFDTSYVGFMKDGAQWLANNTDLKLVGKTMNVNEYILEASRFFELNSF